VAAELMELVKDRAWLVKMTNAINQHWQKRSAAKKNLLAKGVTDRHSKIGTKALAESGRETLNVWGRAVFPHSHFAISFGLNRCGQMRKFKL
jgi:hypothetical protein